MEPPREVGPRDTTPEGPDTITKTSSHDSTATGQPWPQTRHADLGLVDDGREVGS